MKTTPRNISVLMMFGLSLAACGGGSSGDEEDKETVFDPLVQNIDKAKQVEDQVMQQKDKLDEALREAEGAAEDAEDDGTD